MFKTFSEALSWINGRLKFGVKPGLQRMEWLLNELDHPEKKLKAIHVAGTNGKGSTVAYIRSVLNEAGYSAGTFTSPYIITFNERISVDGIPISDEEWTALFNEVYPLVLELEKTDLGAATEFEIITACAFLYFAKYRKTDFVIFEAGLGGRLDSTNVVEPLVTVITSIGHDHTAILGETLEEIAREKAGIIKHGVPVLTAVHQPEAAEVIKRRAMVKEALYLSLHEHCERYDERSLPDGELFSLITPQKRYEQVETGLIGTHQRQNAALAILAAEWLTAVQQANISRQALYSGIKKAAWAGRFEKVLDKPLTFIDGAHNKEGVSRLSETVLGRFGERNIHVCFSALKDKPYQDMIRIIEAFASSIHFASFDFPRAESAQKLFEQSRAGHKTYDESIGSVLDFIHEKTADEKAVVVITGSLYFISEVRSLLNEHKMRF
ncbi:MULTISPECIES: bifunctional folylpolyglutamate synthase/dihydrofolate synthase [Bacillus]|uniref:bifunctional folylpolyglutamate synthase/dihydrofolate synthase n=1 Tax=Bacillus TaxID=1386 RepID=UPI000429EE0A|nr:MULTISPECIES: folylpolyglutamate synthase/dihydrofolate synthase family protein [Bacillus]QHZ47923.1 bifunctional folylpolyglutamate synthase/dihydrofolate synthase [Bacillus sp. NSP9.1]WFA04004.1 bifunctional folylpolyglutamate synthase/dihydrofolate synthase [Bacillus sp. HSf4]